MCLCQSQEGNKSEPRPISADAWEQEPNDLQHKAMHSVILSQKHCGRGHDPTATKCGLARGDRAPRSRPCSPTAAPSGCYSPKTSHRAAHLGNLTPCLLLPTGEPCVKNLSELSKGTGKKCPVTRGPHVCLDTWKRLSNNSFFLKHNVLIFQLQ